MHLRTSRTTVRCGENVAYLPASPRVGGAVGMTVRPEHVTCGSCLAHMERDEAG